MQRAQRKKSYFLGGLLLVMLLVTAAGAGEVKIALDCPPDLEKCGTYVWSHAFGNHLKANGIEVKEYATEALGREDERLDQVSQGLLEVTNSMLMKIGQIDPAINAFWLPFLWDSYEHLDRAVAKSDLMDKINAKTTQKGVRVLALVPVGGFVGIANTKKPIHVPADLKNMRMRATDRTQAKYFAAWGADTVVIPWPEIYNSLQTGVADGYMNPAIVPTLFKHTEILKHFADVRAAASLRVSIASEDWYAGLADKERAIVDEAVVKADAANRAWLQEVTKKSIAALKEAGVQVTSPNETQRAEFAAMVKPVYQEVVAADVLELFLSVSGKYR